MVGEMDQAVEDAKQTARPLAAFWLALEQAGVDAETARQLAILYAQRILVAK